MRRRMLLVVALCGCAAAPTPVPAPPTGAEERDEPVLSPGAGRYATEAWPGGVRGGRTAETLAVTVDEALRARGARPLPDGALAATAEWFLNEAAAGRRPRTDDGDGIARHFGFAGGVLTSVAFSLGSDDPWQQALASLPSNLPVNRYGIRASAGGVAAVVFGTVEATLDPIPRRLAPGQTVRVRGEVGSRFGYARVYLTGSDGQVSETRLPSRRIDTRLVLAQPGVHRVEVMGDGPTGPVVLVNVPIYVGVPEPSLATTRSPAVAAATSPPAGPEVEARMLSLLNAARAQARVAPLASDAELRAVALGHSEDMARARFFGHVSPTTGSAEDRIKRAGIVLAMAGENIAQADSAEGAHQSLMDSPGHRANMVSPRFTHVGIAAVPSPSEPGQVVVTLVFGRRTPTIRWTAPDALAALAALRKARGLPEAVPDPVLSGAAAAGSEVFRARGADEALAEASAALSREARRRGVARKEGCATLIEILEPDQLEQSPLLMSRALTRIGLGTTTRMEGKQPLLVLIVLAEGVACR